MPYIPFTEEQKLKAASTDLPAFLSSRGVELKRSGREYRLAGDTYITIRDNQWYDQAGQQGGNAISFIKRFYDLSYPEAVTTLLEGGSTMLSPSSIFQPQVKKRKPFALPKVHVNMRRVFAYLIKQRCIPGEVISHFARVKMLYQSAEPAKNGKVYNNAVFVGVDEKGVPRHAHQRGLNSIGQIFRGNIEGSNPLYSFHHTGTSNRLYVFEAPIDMLSFIALYPKNWQNHSYVSLCGVAEYAMLKCLELNPQICYVHLCLDNDARGQEATERLKGILTGKGYPYTEVLEPLRKDWNEDLQALATEENTMAEVVQDEPQMLLMC